LKGELNGGRRWQISLRGVVHAHDEESFWEKEMVDDWGSGKGGEEPSKQEGVKRGPSFGGT